MEPTKQKKRVQYRRRFTDEFKASAARLVVEEGKSVNQVARDLDLVASALGNWVKQAKADRGTGPAGSVTSSEKEELARLRREVRILRMEREILKKQRPSLRRRAREIHVHRRGEGHLAGEGHVPGTAGVGGGLRRVEEAP